MAARNGAHTPALSQGERERRGWHYRGGYEFGDFIERARGLRKRQTRAEKVLWERLRGRQLCNAKFRRQHQFRYYICDFYCDEAKLVVECDGSSHDFSGRRARDAIRDAIMRTHGLTVLRFKNDRVLNDTNAVLREIAAHLPSPKRPSPCGEKGGVEGHREKCRG